MKARHPKLVSNDSNSEGLMNSQERIDEGTTREVAQTWFTSMAKGDGDKALSLLAENVEWINYTIVPGMNDAMPWIGTYHGVNDVAKSLGVFLGLCQVKFEELVDLFIDGENAIGIVHEVSVVKETRCEFEIEFVQWLKIRNGKIVRWKSYTDPSSIIAALKGIRPARQR
jgi:ketosteroid isomerase-like protein